MNKQVIIGLTTEGFTDIRFWEILSSVLLKTWHLSVKGK
jgi:hypothetical protein